MKYKNFAKKLNNGFKTNNSMLMASSRRQVIEDEVFWKKAGNLISGSDKIELFK